MNNNEFKKYPNAEAHIRALIHEHNRMQDFAIATETILAIFDMYKDTSPWISVEERLPDHENNVLVVLDGKVCVMAYFSFKDGGKTYKVWGYVYDGLDGDAIYDDDYEPTKWMEIPNP